MGLECRHLLLSRGHVCDGVLCGLLRCLDSPMRLLRCRLGGCKRLRGLSLGRIRGLRGRLCLLELCVAARLLLLERAGLDLNSRLSFLSRCDFALKELRDRRGERGLELVPLATQGAEAVRRHGLHHFAAGGCEARDTREGCHHALDLLGVDLRRGGRRRGLRSGLGSLGGPGALGGGGRALGGHRFGWRGGRDGRRRQGR
mmetsp:Transcript_122793/g.382301  ORF Transcript_122793/g.382301 Transcript_122793/m.382301 type:complete len:201 (+) Transcript_122793:627-1229(+)